MNQQSATFSTGLRNVADLRRALPLYLASLILGLVQTWPVLFGFASGRLDRLNLQRLLNDSDAVVGLLSQTDVLPVIGWWVLLLPMISAIYGFVYNLFSGGMLSVWNDSRSFWAGSRRFFLSFSALGVMLVVLALIVATVTGIIATSVASATTIVIVVGAVVLQVTNLFGEYARAIAVVRDRRNPFVIFGAAISFCVRHPATFGLGVLGLLLQLGLGAAYLGLFRFVGSSPLSIVIDQIFVFAWLAIKLLRLAWARAYAARVFAERIIE